MSEDTMTGEDVLSSIQMTDEEFAKASVAAAHAISQYMAKGYKVPDPSNKEEWLALYHDYVWAYAGIYAIASTIAQLKVQLKKPNASGKLEVVTDTDAMKITNLLNVKPNNTMTGYDLWEATAVYLECTGNEYWEVVYSSKQIEEALTKRILKAEKYPTELWPLNPAKVTPQPKKNGRGIDHYLFKADKSDQKGKKFKPEFITPFAYFNPVDPWFGQGSMYAVKDDLMADMAMAAWNKDFFQHGAVPEGLITTDKTLNPRDISTLAAQIKSMIKGEGRTVLIFGKGLNWQTISLKQKDVDFLEGRRARREAIISALGVPPVKLGLLEHAKYDNYRLQAEAFHRDTIIPKIKKLESALNCFLLPKFPGAVEAGYVLCFDTSPILMDDQDKLAKRLVLWFEHGWITPNQACEKLGIDPYPEGVKGGDLYYMKKTLLPVAGPEDQMPKPAENSAYVEIEEPDMTTLEDEVNKSLEDISNRMDVAIEEAVETITEQVTTGVQAFIENASSREENKAVSEG